MSNYEHCPGCGRFTSNRMHFCATCELAKQEREKHERESLAIIQHNNFKARFDGVHPVNLGENLAEGEFLIVSRTGDWLVVCSDDEVAFNGNTIVVKDETEGRT